MNIISFSGISDVELHLNELRQYLIDFADAKNVQQKIIV